MRRDIGVAPAGPPQPVDPEPGHLQEGDLLGSRGLGNVMDGKAGPERLLIGDAVDQRVLEIAALIVVGLHRHDIGAIGHQHQILGDLQMMRARVGAGGPEIHRLQIARIGSVDRRQAVAEHVADIDVAPVEHDLHAVRPPALIAIADQSHVARMVGLRKLGAHR